MTTDEAITDLEILLANIPKYIRSYRSIEMGVKALKQYGALQEIRQEMAESKHNHRGEYNRELAFNICLQIIDKHIKEIEGEDI